MQVAAATPVMLATDISYADILVASTAANKIGAEVYWVSNDTIPEEIYSIINEQLPEEIYIIGGPAVVSEEVEANLSETYNVTRIWGMTRFGTSAEVAKYFWPEGSDRAVIAIDIFGNKEVNEYVAELISKARDIALTESIPLVLIPKESIPSETEEALKELEVKEVYLVGEVADEVKSYLADLGINIIEEAETIEEAEDIAMNASERLIIVAVSEWKDIITVPFVPKGVALLVRNDNEIPSVVEKVKTLVEEGKVTDIKVVGIPWKAQKICDALSQENITYECITGKRTIIAKKVMEKIRERIEKLREEYEEEIEKIKEYLEKKKERIEERCELAYEKANEIAENMEETPATVSARLELLRALKEDCENVLDQGRYRAALKIANEMEHHAKLIMWQYRSEFGEEVSEEMFSETQPRKRLIEKARVITQDIERIRAALKTVPQECREMLTKAKQLIDQDEITRAMEYLKIAKMSCEREKLRIAKEIVGKMRKERVCVQVLTHAVSPEGECKVFPTPCDVPEGWKVVRSCVAQRVSEKVSEAEAMRKECAKLAKELRELRGKEGVSEEEIEEKIKEIRAKCISPVAQVAVETTSTIRETTSEIRRIAR